jgi:predicted flap endonuclease-1-like 5' DNA nuclease
MRIEEIEGVGPAFAQKLMAAGVPTIEALLEQGSKAAERARLAASTGISEQVLLKWVNTADLMRVKGIGSEYSELLEVAGVDSATELAQRRPENLHARLEEINDARKLVRRVPTLQEVERWVAEARRLPKVVTH